MLNADAATVVDPYHQIIDTLSRCSRVLVTTHVRPDGDALGSCVALILGMRKVGIAAELLTLSRLPRKYAFIASGNDIDVHDADVGWPAGLADLERFDAVIVCDTGTWSQLPMLKERIDQLPIPKLVIDHHLTQEEWATEKLVITGAAAAGEIIAELLDQWKIELDPAIAGALFLAIASDTGWFQFANTRPYTYRLAARLIEAGVDTDRMYQLLYQNERAERVALQSRAQQSLELKADGRLAVMQVSRRDFEETRADVADTENVINIPLQIQQVQASILLTEPKDGSAIRISLRSKGQIDVARFAERFGGGGHARASGLKIKGTLQEAHDQVVTAMIEAMGS